MKAWVIDASVVLKWYFPDEEGAEQALSLLRDYVEEKVELYAPSLIDYEVLNGVLVALRKGRLQREQMVHTVENFQKVAVHREEVGELFPRILSFSESYGRSAYDASYLALTEARGASLITADRRLYNAVSKELPWVFWIEDYGGSAASPKDANQKTEGPEESENHISS